MAKSVKKIKSNVKKTKVVKAKVKAKAPAAPPKPAAPAARAATALGRDELTIYRQKLIALKDEIFKQIKDISEDALMQSQKDSSGENPGYTLHMADVASDNYEREFNFRLVSGDRELLLEIDAALKKVEDGDYGVCVMCDKLIGKSRLNVIPYAKYCRKCKEQLESQGKL